MCNRITYVCELGYALNIPAEQAVHVYDRVVEAGKELGLRHAGLRALGSLRMEKAYRDYGHDIDNTDDPYETGLGFAVRLDKPAGFIGKQACLGKQAELELLPMQDGDVRATMADISDLEQAVGFRPNTPLEQGLEKFVAWYREYYGA